MTNINLATIARAARDGFKITFTPDGEDKPKTIWAGLGNRSGLHGFAYELTEKKWAKSGERLEKKLKTLKGGTIAIHDFRNITRDRGRWVRTSSVKV